MKNLMLLISLTTSSLVLSGCSAMPIKNSISFQINDHLKGQDVVYKNNWPECSNLTMTPDWIIKQKYITSYSRCKVSPEGYVPEQIIIEYAPWLTEEQQQKIPELKGKKVIITGDRVTPYGITKDAFLGKMKMLLNTIQPFLRKILNLLSTNSPLLHGKKLYSPHLKK